MCFGGSCYLKYGKRMLYIVVKRRLYCTSLSRQIEQIGNSGMGIQKDAGEILVYVYNLSFSVVYATT